MNVVNFANHFCYITDLGRATSSLKCPRCNRLWKRDWNLRRHEKSCTGELVKHRYPGGVYTPPSTPLEILQRNGLNVDTTYVYPYRATYDYEAYFDHDDLPQNPESDNTRYTSRHVPMSLAVSSNVPSYDEPVCFVSEGDPQKLVDRMFDHLEEIAQHAYLLSREEFADVYDELAAMAQEEEEDEGEEKENCSKYVSPLRGLIGTEDVIRKVEEGQLFGMVQCDVEVPDHLRASFAEMLPVFKNAKNAKLRMMLQFYYDCVARFVSKEDFQLCEMDTDSLYMALSAESLESAILRLMWGIADHPAVRRSEPRDKHREDVFEGRGEEAA
ncbi:hypothetical protein ACOMHN_056510 [Nucella lapillus]